MEEPENQQSLGESFRQSRKEFWVMIGTWIAFALWTGAYNGIFASEAKENVELFFGMPKWVFLGVAAPWAIALAVTIWFALCFMQDTPLDLDESSGEESGGGK